MFKGYINNAKKVDVLLEMVWLQVVMFLKKIGVA